MKSERDVDHNRPDAHAIHVPWSSAVQPCIGPPEPHLAGARLDESFFADLRTFHHIRQFGMEARKRSDLSLGALLRDALGWSLKLSKAERTEIEETAADLIATGERLQKWNERVAAKPNTKVKRPVSSAPAVFEEWQEVIAASLLSRAPMLKVEEDAEARMEVLAAQLPVAQWWRASVFKSSLTSLAVIVAETGDLANYATVSKVWKRMGVAVMERGDGSRVRQGGLPKTSSKAEWIAHGYVRRRRSLLFVIGVVLIKQNAHYRAVYLAEKERLRARAEANGLKVVPSAQIPEKSKAEFMSDGHVHNMARRNMEKQLLLDLWVEWRRAISRLEPSLHMPAAENSPQGDGSQRAFDAQGIDAPDNSGSQFTVDSQIGDAANGSGQRRHDAQKPTAAPDHFR